MLLSPVLDGYTMITGLKTCLYSICPAHIHMFIYVKFIIGSFENRIDGTGYKHVFNKEIKRCLKGFENKFRFFHIENSVAFLPLAEICSIDFLRQIEFRFAARLHVS